VSGVLHSVFWCSSAQRENAVQFNDVLIFDPNYQTNDPGLPLACFLGVNKNGNTTVLSCAMFLWLYVFYGIALSTCF
jgi:hypothetical protein